MKTLHKHNYTDVSTMAQHSSKDTFLVRGGNRYKLEGDLEQAEFATCT